MNNEFNSIDFLEKVLSNVNEWLKYAEAKNAALLLLSSGIVLGVLRILSSYEFTEFFVTAYLFSLIFFSLVTLVVCLFSFIPRLVHPFWLKYPMKNEFDNPLFFGDVCKYSKKSYLDLVAKSCDIAPNTMGSLESNYADQIVINSKIAFIKYRTFSFAIWMFITAILTPFGALAMWLLRK